MSRSPARGLRALFVKGPRPRGFSLIEVVVASSLLLLVLTGSSVALANVERELAQSRLNDTATALGVSLTERAMAFGCGLAVDPSSSSTQGVAQRCAAVYSGTASAVDASFTATDPDGRQFSVTMTSRWLQIGALDTCYSRDVAAVGQAQLLRPSLLERTARLTYTLLGETRTQEVTVVEATPESSAYNGVGTGGLVVSAPAGALVTVDAVTGAPLRRFSSECGGASGAYFPFLPPGEYRVSVNGAQGVPVNVVADTVSEA